MKDQRLHDFLAKINVKWQFNLSIASWLGGQFKRLVRLVKRAFCKTVGNGTLCWVEVQDVLLDMEVALNNQPLTYVKDYIHLSTLTPNLLQFGHPNLLNEVQSHQLLDPDLRKSTRYLARCKDALWGRCT